MQPPDHGTRLAYHQARELRERQMALGARDERSRDVHLQLANQHKLEGLLLLLWRPEETPAAALPGECRQAG